MDWGGEVKARKRQEPRTTPKFVARVNRRMEAPFTNLRIHSSKCLEAAERR